MTVFKPKRRWFQFSLRTLLGVVTLFAILCSCIAVKMRQLEREREEWMSEQKAVMEMSLFTGGDLQTVFMAPPPVCLQSLFASGAYGYTVVSYKGPLVGDTDLENLRRLTRLRKLELCGQSITDSGLESLKGLSQLQEVDILCPQVTDEAIEELKQALPNCKIYANWESKQGITGADYARAMRPFLSCRHVKPYRSRLR